MEQTYDRLVEKWSPVLNEESAGKIDQAHKRAVTAAVLENTEKALMEQGMLQETAANAAGNGVSSVDGGTGAASNWNPILISLVRRAMPNLMAYDICGVQPMSGPTGLIFAMKSRYKTTKAGANGTGSGTEALFNEALVGFSGDSTNTGNGTRGPSGLSGITDTDADSSIVDSGGTLCNAASKLLETGAKEVSAYITHGVLSGEAINRIESSNLKNLVVTDSIYNENITNKVKKIKVISIAKLLGEAISRTSSEESVSSLFIWL